MKGLILEPTIADNEVLVQFTSEVTIDKYVAVRVPNCYQAVLIINEKVFARVPTTTEKKIIEYGKENLNKKCRVAFIRSNISPNMAWGFGNINVNNERLKEAYRVGTNGKYSIEITEIGKLLKCFDGEANITTEVIRDKTVDIIKNIGRSILGKYFENSNISVFEISSHTTDIRKEMISLLEKETAFTTLGLKIHDLTVDTIHVPDEDLAVIQKRINLS